MTIITHGACGKSWSDARAAHCGGCHVTFGSRSLFESHRTAYGPHGGCRDPLALRVGGRPPQLVDDVWHGPEMPAAVLAARRAA